MGAETWLIFILVVGVIIFLFFNRSLIQNAFASGANAINDTVTGTHVVTKQNATEGQVLGQRVVSDTGAGQSAISGEANATLKVFPFAVKDTNMDPLAQRFTDASNKLGRPLTVDETKAIIAQFNKDQENSFLKLGGFVN